MGEDQMKAYFKYYKQRKCLPDMTEVLDFNKASSHKEIIDYDLRQSIDIPPVCGLSEVTKWKAHTVESMPGLVFILNPFQSGSQFYWVHRCLHDYHTKPSKTNLDVHMNIGESDNLWDQSQKKTEADSNDNVDVKNGKLTETDSIANHQNVMSKLRWTTVGYHHDWNTQVYSKDNYSPMPVDMAYLVSYIAAAVGYPDYRTEAAIVNYYHMDSTICAHTDHSEEDKEAPLISVSFGQTAIFLVGGLTKEEKPLAMYLRSGDIVIMMGPSRLRYHAVPRIIPDDQHYAQQCLQLMPDVVLDTNHSTDTIPNQPCSNAATQGQICKLCFARNHTSMQCKSFDWRDQVSEINRRISDLNKTINSPDSLPFKDYMQTSRINMNVRQVFGRLSSVVDSEIETKRVKCDSC